MSEDEFAEWLEARYEFYEELPYPLTIITDKYMGQYSDGSILAFNANPNEIDPRVFGSDSESIDYWSEFHVVGVGYKVPDAISDLMNKMKKYPDYINTYTYELRAYRDDLDELYKKFDDLLAEMKSNKKETIDDKLRYTSTMKKISIISSIINKRCTADYTSF